MYTLCLLYLKKDHNVCTEKKQSVPFEEESYCLQPFEEELQHLSLMADCSNRFTFQPWPYIDLYIDLSTLATVYILITIVTNTLIFQPWAYIDL